MPLPEDALQTVLASLHATGAIKACREFAAKHSKEAIAAISGLASAEAASALITIAEATTFRKN